MVTEYFSILSPLYSTVSPNLAVQCCQDNKRRKEMNHLSEKPVFNHEYMNINLEQE